MNKKILTLALTGIKYIGDSIGNDIRVEIDVFGQLLRIDKIIKARKGDSMSVGVLEVID